MVFPGESGVATQEKGCMQFRCHHCKTTVEQGFSWTGFWTQDHGQHTLTD